MRDKQVKEKGYLVYYDYEVQYDLLTDEELGKVHRAMMKFAKYGEKPHFEEKALKLAIAPFLAAHQRNAEKYEQEVLRRKERDANRYEEKKALLALLKSQGHKQEEDKGSRTILSK